MRAPTPYPVSFGLLGDCHLPTQPPSVTAQCPVRIACPPSLPAPLPAPLSPCRLLSLVLHACCARWDMCCLGPSLAPSPAHHGCLRARPTLSLSRVCMRVRAVPPVSQGVGECVGGKLVEMAGGKAGGGARAAPRFGCFGACSQRPTRPAQAQARCLPRPPLPGNYVHVCAACVCVMRCVLGHGLWGRGAREVTGWPRRARRVCVPWVVGGGHGEQGGGWWVAAACGWR